MVVLTVGVVVRTDDVVVRAEVGGVVLGSVDGGADNLADADEDAVAVGDVPHLVVDDDGDRSEVWQAPRCFRAIHAGAPMAIASSGQVIV